MGVLLSKPDPPKNIIITPESVIEDSQINTDYTTFSSKKDNTRYYEGEVVYKNKKGRYTIIENKKRYLPMGAKTSDC